jgi:hypothetical protein
MANGDGMEGLEGLEKKLKRRYDMMRLRVTMHDQKHHDENNGGQGRLSIYTQARHEEI